MNEPDWGLVRSFLAVARLGSLSAAARDLGVSQPTLSREIQALEAATGLNLFRRTTQGLVLTDQGQTLVDAAEHMSAAADRFARQASGLSVEPEGDVRISANEIVGTYLLPPVIAAFREQHPAVHLEVVISNGASSLSKREADIALRMFRPTQPDLVARRLPALELGFYAHRDYLDRHGEPADLAAFKSHCLIGFDESLDFIDAAAKLGHRFVPDDFAVRTDHLLCQIQLLRSGVGIGGTHVGLANHWPELVRIMHWAPLPALPFWCVTHRDVQYNSRIRAVM
ncbi:MAG: LysR family transcriptional regulator, partial [Gammaproteobacteria bacterium]